MQYQGFASNWVGKCWLIASCIVFFGGCDSDRSSNSSSTSQPLPAITAEPGSADADLQNFVISAIKEYDQHGESAFATLADTRGAFNTADTYLFVLDGSGVLQVHAANNELIGQDFYAIPDSDGFLFTRYMLDHADADGTWIAYRFTNPLNGDEEPKVAWVVKYGGFIFGAGYFVNDERWVAGLLDQTLGAHKRNGYVVFQDISDTSGSYTRGAEYVFALTSQGVGLASPYHPDIVGADISQRVDSDGIQWYQRILEDASVDGDWVAYRSRNPMSFVEEPKISLVVARDEIIFGSGLYVPVGRWIKTILEESIRLYEREGEHAFARLSAADGGYQHGEHYPFVLDADGIIRAHPDPTLIGQDQSSVTDLNGFAHVSYMLGWAGENGLYVDYRHVNPITGQPANKLTWFVRHADYVFGIGVYPKNWGRPDLDPATAIASVSTRLCHVHLPGQDNSALCDTGETYARGSDVANLVARSFLHVAPEADIAVHNAGGSVADIEPGDLTIARIGEVFPWPNILMQGEITGRELVAALEDALDFALVEDGSTGAYPYAAGLRYHVDASQEKGERISQVQINPQLRGQWKAIDLEGRYQLVTSNFIAAGNDGFETFGRLFQARRFTEIYVKYKDAFIALVESLTARGQQLERPDLDTYSTQNYIGTDGCDHNATTSCVGY
ncbi:MAG: cache domain-containing protein [Pseudomonadota bacterium]